TGNGNRNGETGGAAALMHDSRFPSGSSHPPHCRLPTAHCPPLPLPVSRLPSPVSLPKKQAAPVSRRGPKVVRVVDADQAARRTQVRVARATGRVPTRRSEVFERFVELLQV